MIIKIGAMALLGISFIKGRNNKELIKKQPVVTAVNPVRPPAAIPAAVSTVLTVGLDQNKAEVIVDKALD